MVFPALPDFRFGVLDLLASAVIQIELGLHSKFNEFLILFSALFILK